MLIGIDGNEANVQRKVGISEYAYELLRQFSKLSLRTGLAPARFIVYLKNKPLKDLPKENENWRYNVLTPQKFWTQWRLPLDLYLQQPRPDVFFSPTHYAPRFSPIPTTISVMDLSYLYFPELFKKTDLYQLRNWTSYSLKNAKKVLTISNSTKFDIIKEYKIAENKIKVIYPGIKPATNYSEQNMNILKTKYNITGDYILFVGTLQPRKNINRLIEAFSQIIPERSDNKEVKSHTKNLQLIIIGKKGWMYEEILKKPKELNIENKVKFLDFVPDEDLAVFYKNAVCYVLPSLYEGFGLPILEAMQHDCPVITSNISSLPEAGGDAALYVNPKDINDISLKIKQLISDINLRRSLIQKGKKQITKFNWEKTARETLKTLEAVTGK
jgi:glycosyltransferase involved in cell wall biosynthesis